MKVSEALSIADLRRMARRRLPKVVFETIESGVEDERCVTRNEEAYREQLLLPRHLVDVGRVTQEIVLFGRRYASPFGMAPTGFAGVFRKGADSMMAAGARLADIPMVLSGASIEALEDVSAVAPEHVWSHLYPAKDMAVTNDLLARALDAGCEVLVITVDNPVYPNRERDTRNRFGKPVAAQKLSTLVEASLHPTWVFEFLRRGGFPVMENWARYAGKAASGPEVAAYFRSQSPAVVTWRDLDHIRQKWPRTLVLKGLQHPDDARTAIRAGVDGIILSNHGGKAHDPLPAPLHLLPSMRRTVGPSFPLMIDSGIRRGSDIVIAACLGAAFTFVGRPMLYGVAAGGLEGVSKAVEILRREIDISLALIGCPDFSCLGPEYLFSGDADIQPPAPIDFLQRKLAQ